MKTKKGLGCCSSSTLVRWFDESDQLLWRQNDNWYLAASRSRRHFCSVPPSWSWYWGVFQFLQQSVFDLSFCGRVVAFSLNWDERFTFDHRHGVRRLVVPGVDRHFICGLRHRCRGLLVVDDWLGLGRVGLAAAVTVRDFQGGAGFQRDAHQRYLELHGSHGHAGLEQDVSAAGVAADEWVVEIWGDRAAADVLAGEIGCKVIAQVNPSVFCAHKQSTTKKKFSEISIPNPFNETNSSDQSN